VLRRVRRQLVQDEGEVEAEVGRQQDVPALQQQPLPERLQRLPDEVDEARRTPAALGDEVVGARERRQALIEGAAGRGRFTAFGERLGGATACHLQTVACA